MLVHNDKLVPLLLSTLMLEPEHPRKKMAEHLKAGIQADGIESIAQLALFDRGRELLLQHEAVLAGLQWVIEEHSGTSPELKESARGAMMALNGVEQHVPMSTITSHFKKRGATSQLAWSGASGAEVTKCCTHSNVASKNLYLQKQAVDMVPVRQLLNAPPGMLQAGETPALAASPPQSGAVLGATIRRVRSLHVMAGRAFSNLDVFTEVKRTSSVTQELLVLQRTAEQSGLLQLVHQQQATIASLAMALSSFTALPPLPCRHNSPHLWPSR
jgi:hypothetical protein